MKTKLLTYFLKLNTLTDKIRLTITQYDVMHEITKQNLLAQ